MESEKEVLLNLYRQKGRESRRYHAVLLVKSGKTQAEVARLLFVDEGTIRNWINEWNTNKKLEDKQRSGRPRKITKEIEKEMCDMVDENNPEKEGMHASTWDCRELRIWLMDKYGIQLTSERIRKILKKNGFNYRKINYKFTKADETKREQFLEDFRDLHQNIEGTLIFQDEMASKLHPNKGYIWTREKKPVIETECNHEKTYLIGGVSPDDGETYTVANKKFNSNVFIEFLALLLASIKGDIFLVLDNHPSHHSKVVQKFLENNPRINLIFLPEYSPDLNPKENFWNYIRKKFLNNKVFVTVEDMAREVVNFIKNIPKEVVKRVCSYKYLLRATP